MPDIIVIIGSGSLAMFGILYLIFSCIDGTLNYKSSWLAIPILLLVWISLYGSAEWKYTDHPNIIVHKVDNIDVVKINNDIINLNDTFRRSFKDGEKITIQERMGISYYGIFPIAIHDKYKLASTDSIEEETP